MEILGIMSDLSNALNALSRSRTQLPVSAYFDEALYKAELERIFQSGPRYLGHANAIPEWATITPYPRKGKVALWCARPTASS